jgi:septin family protein
MNDDSMFEEDSLIMNVEKMINSSQIKEDTLNEVSILEKNNQKFLNLNPVNFNVLVIGESESGKSTFIKCFMNKMQKSCNNHNKSYNSSTNENSDNVLKDNKNTQIPKNDTTLRDLIESALLQNQAKEDNNGAMKDSVVFKENFVQYSTPSKRFKFNLIDSTGYGQTLNNKSWLSEIMKFVKKRV